MTFTVTVAARANPRVKALRGKAKDKFWDAVDRLEHEGLATVSAVAFNALLKAILGPTPLQIGLHDSFAPGNFPSGHVVYITSLCGLLGWFALARGHRATSVAMLLLILAMGPLRVIDGAHWPSDVLAGYALGLAWTITVLALGLPWAAGAKGDGKPPDSGGHQSGYLGSHPRG